jgi:hypothetical protein
MNRAADYATPAAVSPTLELAAVLTLGFAWIYRAEWGDVPVLWTSLLLVAPVISFAVGSLHWYGLKREIKRVAQITLMHGITELFTLAAAGTGVGFMLHRRFTAPPVVERDVRVFEQLIAASVLASLGALFGLAVFVALVPVTGASFKAEYRKLTSA